MTVQRHQEELEGGAQPLPGSDANRGILRPSLLRTTTPKLRSLSTYV